MRCLGTMLLALLVVVGTARAEPSLDVNLDARERATYQSAIAFDDGEPDAGWFWTQRLSATGTWSGESGIGATVTLLSALSEGVSTSPVERNALDVHRVYLSLDIAGADVTIGRQELQLGSQRLIGVREGTNVRRTWDGLRIGRSIDSWHVDAFGLRLVEVEPNGAFNDSSDDDRRIAGIYATGPAGWTNLDIYYLGSWVDDRSTIEGIADQDRHSVGVRAFGARDAWFWNWEAIIQAGSHGDSDIEAWTLATNTGYRLDGPLSPEIMLSANMASGDSEPGDGTLETFDALYPRGSYFSEAAILGPSNFYNVNPYLRLWPRENVSLSLDVNWYWRLKRYDGVYAPPGTLLRPAIGQQGRFVSRAVSFALDWELTRQWRVGIVATHAEPGPAIAASGPSDDVSFLELTVAARLF